MPLQVKLLGAPKPAPITGCSADCSIRNLQNATRQAVFDAWPLSPAESRLAPTSLITVGVSPPVDVSPAVGFAAAGIQPLGRDRESSAEHNNRGGDNGGEQSRVPRGQDQGDYQGREQAEPGGPRRADDHERDAEHGQQVVPASNIEAGRDTRDHPGDVDPDVHAAGDLDQPEVGGEAPLRFPVTTSASSPPSASTFTSHRSCCRLATTSAISGTMTEYSTRPMSWRTCEKPQS